MALTPPKVWVTRDEPPNGRLCRLLSARHLEPVHAPLVRIEPLTDGEGTIAQLRTDDWLVLTSPRAVELVSPEVARIRPRIAVAGRVSEAAATARGFPVEFVSPTESAAGIWNHLRTHAGGRTVCFARSRRADPPGDPPPGLQLIDLYDVVEVQTPGFLPDSVCVATFTSRSAVMSCLNRFGGIPVPGFSIGPTTTSSLLDAGGRVLGEARSSSLESLADAVSDWSKARTP